MQKILISLTTQDYGTSLKAITIKSIVSANVSWFEAELRGCIDSSVEVIGVNG